MHSLQEERSATLAHLQEPAAAGKSPRMVGQRQYTNQQLRKLGKLVADSPVEQMSDAVGAAVARSTAAHAELGAARKSVDAGRFFATEADVFYTKVIRADLDLPGVIAASGTTELAQRLQAYPALSSAIEYAAHERDLVEVALLRGTLTEADFALSSALVAQQRQALQDFQRDAPGRVLHPTGQRTRQVRRLRDRPGTPGTARPAQGQGSGTWAARSRGSPPRTPGSRR